MEIVAMNLLGENLKAEEINRLVLENSVCSEIISDVLESLGESNEKK